MTNIATLTNIIIVVLIAFNLLYVLGKNRKRIFVRDYISRFTVILLLLSVIVTRYNHENKYYLHDDCNMISASSSIESNKSNSNVYKIIYAPIPYETYNKYIVTDIEDNCNYILTTNKSLNYNLGDRIIIRSNIATGMAAGTASEYDYYKYHATYIYDRYKIKTSLATNTTSLSIREKILEIKNKLSKNYNLNHDHNVSALLSGITLGTDITENYDLKKNMQSSGLSHIAVMSGYNVLIMMAVIFAIFKFINYFLSRFRFYYFQNINIRNIVALILLSVLPLANNWEAPITRAYIFIIITVLYTIVGRVENYKYIFWATLFIIICYSPHAAMNDIGLHLSMLAILSLLYTELRIRLIIKRCTEYLLRKHSVPIDRENWLLRYCSTIVSAQLLILPYTMIVFDNYNLWSFISNFFVVFLLPIITIMALIENLVITIGLETIASIIALPLDMLINYIINIAEKFSLHNIP